MKDLYGEIVLAPPVEVMDFLFVGSQYNFERDGQIFEDRSYQNWESDLWRILHATNEPYHREFVGYTDRWAPPGPEQFYAIRGHRMALNLDDATDPEHICFECVDAGVKWIRGGLEAGKAMFCHCNMGVSRSPSIAMVTMASLGELSHDISEARAEFKQRYDRFLPGQGMSLFVERNWERLINS